MRPRMGPPGYRQPVVHSPGYPIADAVTLWTFAVRRKWTGLGYADHDASRSTSLVAGRPGGRDPAEGSADERRPEPHRLPTLGGRTYLLDRLPRRAARPA